MYSYKIDFWIYDIICDTKYYNKNNRCNTRKCLCLNITLDSEICMASNNFLTNLMKTKYIPIVST